MYMTAAQGAQEAIVKAQSSPQRQGYAKADR